MKPEYTLVDLANALGCEYQGNPDILVTSISSLRQASSGALGFVGDTKYLKDLEKTKASVVILRPEHAELCHTDGMILTDNPYLKFANAANLLSDRPLPEKGIAEGVRIGAYCGLADDLSISHNVVIGDRVKIGEGAIIGPGCIIAQGCRIGAHTRLHANVTLYDGVEVGEHCEIHSGAVIGSEGFGHAQDEDAWVKIPQMGYVILEDHVEIGANTTIDRGSLDDTIIRRGAVIDNLVQIAHNVEIGELTGIAACAGIAGSAKIGARCLIGGGVGIAGHLKICDGVMLTGMAMVTGSVNKPGLYSSGTGLLPSAQWRKSAVRFRQLDQLAKRLAVVEDKIS